ncbi:MAG TPA: tripartite tricarboxylate transporter TctB family protein [Thermodesulfobacteriota bacterium]
MDEDVQANRGTHADAAFPETTPRASGTDRAGRLAFRLVASGFVLLGLWVCWYARGLTYYTPVGPGPGFFPLWLGLLLTVLSCAVLVRSRRPGRLALPDRFLPERRTGGRMAVTVGMIAVFALGVERAGFVPTMFVVLLVLLRSNGCRLFPTATVIALAATLVVGYSFTHWLNVYLPPVPFGLLGAVGL